MYDSVGYLSTFGVSDSTSDSQVTVTLHLPIPLIWSEESVARKEEELDELLDFEEFED